MLCCWLGLEVGGNVCRILQTWNIKCNQVRSCIITRSAFGMGRALTCVGLVNLVNEAASVCPLRGTLYSLKRGWETVFHYFLNASSGSSYLEYWRISLVCNHMLLFLAWEIPSSKLFVVDFPHWVLLSPDSDKMDVLFLQVTPNRISNPDSFQLGVWILALFAKLLALWFSNVISTVRKALS